MMNAPADSPLTAAPPQAPQARMLLHLLPAIAVLLAGIALTLLGWQALDTDERQAAWRAFLRDTAAFERDLRDDLAHYGDLLQGAAAAMEAGAGTDESAWRALLDRLHETPPEHGFQAVAYAALERHVGAGVVSPHAALPPEGAVPGLGRPGAGEVPAMRVRHVDAPEVPPWLAPGKDVALGHPALADALARIAERGRVGVVSVPWAADANGATAVVLLLPVFRGNAPRASAAQRRVALAGVVLMVLSARELLEGMWREAESGFGVEVEELGGHAVAVGAVGAQGGTATMIERSITVGERTWRVRFHDTAARHGVPASQVLLLAGMALSLAVAVLVGRLAGLHAQARVLARRMTLRVAGSLAEARRSEDALRDALLRFESVLENTPLVAVQGFLRDGTVLHWNTASELLYGVSRSRALGRRLQDVLWGCDGGAGGGRAPDDHEGGARGERAPPGQDMAADFEQGVDEVWRSGRATAPGEWPVDLPGGRRVWVYSCLFPVFENGQVSEVFCMDVDITARKQAEADLRRHRDDLAMLVAEQTADLLAAKTEADRALARAEEANQAKSMFLANMSHELRTPMHAILGYARLGEERARGVGPHAALPPRGAVPGLGRPGAGVVGPHAALPPEGAAPGLGRPGAAGVSPHAALPPEGAVPGLGRPGAGDVPRLGEYFRRIRVGGERLLHLLNDLLDLSKLEAGKMVLHVVPQDPVVALREVVAEFQPLLAARSMRAEVVPPGARLLLQADATRLGQVLRNLLSNAIKFSPEGGRVELRCRAATLPADPLSADGVAAAVEIIVADDGVGIPEGELEAVFDKFVQSSKTRTGAGGTGLGLAICREIVTAHGGRIHARNNDGPGASFHVLLPARAARQPEPAPTERPRRVAQTA